MSEALERLRERVLTDPALQARLRGLGSTAAFIAEAVDVASREGLEIARDDVAEALRVARREWLERWI